MIENLVSVIIPTYGRPDFLKRAVDSVLSQTYKRFEIIVVDDNSPESPFRKLTEDVMAQYSMNNVIYLKHPYNKNGAAARNTGLKVANGEYVTFLDDDDEMRPNRLEYLYNRLSSLDETWCCCYSGFSKMKPNGVVDVCGENRTGDLYIEALMRSLYFCPGSNMFIRMKNVQQINGFDEEFRRNQDLEFLARLLETGKIAYIPEDTLIIHYEDNHSQSAFDYQKLVSFDKLYLQKFKSRIDALSESEQKRIYKYFALERFRYSIRTNEISDGIRNCIRNKVSVFLFLRYLLYIVYRLVTKKSVGFRI